MGFPSPAKDYAESTLTVGRLCGYDGNCRTIETSAGYAIINVAKRPKAGDTVLISFCGSWDFASVQGKALITQDGEAIEGDSLDDANVLGVVTFFLNRVADNDLLPVI
ncbi:hypothetical protein ACOTXN_22540 [Enterobacter cloacae complex sp. IR53043]|nr:MULTISPECIES: hypothetical protein [Enterobacter cloacae complex]DAL18381.1 MAG TPA_asm: LexA repressor [Caudoviricetes sp.]HED2150987.1 hypothetical protein [Enterobacter hormaechei subsp. hormaechei]AIE64461.1 hypothetical protein ECNIH2_14005 [Enterobacter cloacae ECNIH2]AKK79084.1 hypothetical protein ABY62_21545 [Enterobacter hormaechei]AKK92127.1 hypothetical protein ABY65_12590 [Enterobacter hormaechei]